MRRTGWHRVWLFLLLLLIGLVAQAPSPAAAEPDYPTETACETNNGDWDYHRHRDGLRSPGQETVAPNGFYCQEEDNETFEEQCDDDGYTWEDIEDSSDGNTGFCLVGIPDSELDVLDHDACEDLGGTWEGRQGHAGSCSGVDTEELSNEALCEARPDYQWREHTALEIYYCHDLLAGYDEEHAPSDEDLCETQNGDWDEDAEACVANSEATCRFRPPFGQEFVDTAFSDGPVTGDVPNLPAGAVRESMRWLFPWFFTEREDIEFAPEIVENHPWIVEEVSEYGECTIAHSVPSDGCWDGEVHSPDLVHGVRSIPPDRCWGQYPSGHYDITYDGGGMLDFMESAWGWMTNLFFQIGRWAIQLSFWAFSESRVFSVHNEYGSALFGEGDTDGGAFGAINSEIVDGLGLIEIAWLGTVAYLGVTVARGKLVLAGGQLIITVVLLALASVLLVSPRGYMEGASRVMDGLSDQVFAATASGAAREQCDEGMARDAWTPAEAHEAMERVQCARIVSFDHQRKLHELFVEIPYDYLNWGYSRDDLERHDCRDAQLHRDRILSIGPHSGNDWPRMYMARGGQACEELVRFNQVPTASRALTALVTGLAALLFSVLLGLSALTILLAKLVTGMLFALAPLAAVAAILPGGGRRLAWTWLTTLIQGIAVVVGMSLALAVALLVITPTLETSMERDDPMTSYLLVLGPLVVLWMARQKILAGVKNLSDGMAGRLSGMAPGAGSPGFGGSGGGGAFLGAGGGGGGLPGGSGAALFGAPRPEQFSQGLTAASTATTAALGAGGLALRGGSWLARWQFGLVGRPLRAGGRVLRSRIGERRANARTYGKDVGFNALNRLADGAGGGRTASGGGSRPEDLKNAFKLGLKPKKQVQLDAWFEGEQKIAGRRAKEQNRWPWNGAVDGWTRLVAAGKGKWNSRPMLIGGHHKSREAYPDPETPFGRSGGPRNIAARGAYRQEAMSRLQQAIHGEAWVSAQLGGGQQGGQGQQGAQPAQAAQGGQGQQGAQPAQQGGLSNKNRPQQQHAPLFKSPQP